MLNYSLLCSCSKKFWLKLKQQWTIEEISIFSNSSHLEWRAELSDTTLKVTIPARLGLIWFNGFRGEDLNVKVYDVRRMPSDGKSSHGLSPGEQKSPIPTITLLCSVSPTYRRGNIFWSLISRRLYLLLITGLNFSSSETTMPIRTKLCKNDLCEVLRTDSIFVMIPPKTWPPRASLYIYIIIPVVLFNIFLIKV